MENLENILESILFVNGDAVDVSDITSKIDVSKEEIQEAINNLKTKYNDNSGIVLLEFNNKLQFASNSKYAEDVSVVLNPIRQRNLSKATLETASIIAYKQPITRLEIEQIRGVSSDYAINILLEHNLIEMVGRKDAVGKPALFGTTDEFLKRFNISSIDELPDYNELLDKIQVIKSNDNRLYNHFEVKSSDEEEKTPEMVANEDVALAKEEKSINLDTFEDGIIGDKEFVSSHSEENNADYFDNVGQTDADDPDDWDIV